MTDIDIDFFDRTTVLSLIKHRVAMISNKNDITKYNTGIYVQEIPHNPFSNIATIDYQTAEERGYFKIDFLNVSIYDGVRDESHLRDLLNREPIWEMLDHREIVEKLFHINGHYNIVDKLKPRSIEQLAAVLAIIRPAKRYLLDSDWDTIRKEVWNKPDDDTYYFKKSHSISYATAIVVQMNLIAEQSSVFAQVEQNDV